MFDLSGKKALITGASGGIGGAIARELHRAGADVVLTGRRKEALITIQEALGERAHLVVGDISTAEGVDKVVNEAMEISGGLHILVNNAGLTRDTLMMRMKDEDWQSVLDVNLTAAFRLSRAVLRGMMRQKFGRIINISSIVGVTGNPGQVNYAASKAGMIGMSKSLAAEVASRGITVNCIAPGFIETAMTDELNDTQKEKLLDNIPAGRLGHCEDISAAAAYLASDKAGYMTGQTLHINGGMAMI